MATLRWRGDAPAVAQVDTVTVGGTVEAGDKFILTISNKSLSVSASSTSTATTASEVVTAWNALSATEYPEFAEITATLSGSDVILTGDTKGKPFTVTATTTESNGGAADAQTFVKVSTTACSGPNWADLSTNWWDGSATAAPADGDTLIIENSSVSLLYGLDSSGIEPALIIVRPTFTGYIGLPNWTGTYFEYRSTYWTIGPVILRLEDGVGNGSGRIKINSGADPCSLVINSTGTPIETGVPAFLWKGTDATNTLTITKGSMGIAFFGGETANVSGDVFIGFKSNRDSDVDIKASSGVTWDAITKEGGNLELNSSVTTLTQHGGTTTVQQGGITTAKIRGGTLIYNSTGTLGTATVSGTGAIDFERDPRTKTVTNIIELYGDDAKIYDDFVVVSNLRLDYNEGAGVAKSRLGRHVNITRGAVS